MKPPLRRLSAHKPVHVAIMHMLHRAHVASCPCTTKVVSARAREFSTLVLYLFILLRVL